MITAEQYQEIKSRIAAFESWRNGRTSYKREDVPANVPQVTNEEISLVEVYEFVTNPPSKYFLYIKAARIEGKEDTHYGATGLATTWMGEKLGTVQFGREYISPAFGGFGSKRVSIRVYAINGKTYFGTYYKSSGNYARIKVMKGSK